jgi:hypothetical protein
MSPYDAWYYEHNGMQQGPVSAEQVGLLRARGVISHSTLVWRQGMGDWMPAAGVADLPLPTAVGPGAAVPPIVAGPVVNPAAKSEDGAAVASLILGCLSIMGLFCWGGGVVLAIPGLICAGVSKTRGGVRTAGLVTSIIGLLLGVTGLVFMVAMMVGAARSTPGP